MIKATRAKTGRPVYFWPYDVALIISCDEHPRNTIIFLFSGNVIEVAESEDEVFHLVMQAEDKGPKQPWE